MNYGEFDFFIYSNHVQNTTHIIRFETTTHYHHVVIDY